MKQINYSSKNFTKTNLSCDNDDNVLFKFKYNYDTFNIGKININFKVIFKENIFSEIKLK